MDPSWLDKYPPPRDAGAQKEDAQVPRQEKRADLPVQAKLDVHGKTAEEARRLVRQFIDASAREGKEKVLIIHGKGLHSDGPAVLPLVVREELERHPRAGRMEKASIRDGGSGALIVYVRRN